MKGINIQHVLFLLLFLYVIGVVCTYLFQVKLLVVTSDSMQPQFGFGDVLLARRQEDYALQDIVSFKTGESIATHRIIMQKAVLNLTGSVPKKLFQTQGDANAFPDLNLVSQEQIIGKIVMVIPLFGYVVLFMKTKYIALFFIFFSIVYLLKVTYVQVQKMYRKSYEK